MRRFFLVLGAALACGCGGADFTLPEGGGGDGGDGGGTGEGGGDGGADACAPQPEICGDGVDNDCDGVVDNGCKGLGTFVSGATGNDMNPGTKTMPVKTIGQGIKNAVMIGGKQTVFVAGSHYPEKVTMVEGVSLDGGYHCDAMTCDWARNPAMFDTAILNQDWEGVLAPASITRATRLDGFRVQGMSGAPPNPPGSAGVTVLGSPTISGDRLNGGDVTGGGQGAARSSAVVLLAPISDPNGPLLDNNDVQGGASQSYGTNGVLFDVQAGSPPGSTASATVRNNRIRGGNAQFTNGIAAWSSGANTVIVANTITAGQSQSPNGGGASWGIAAAGTLLVDSNLVNTDPNSVGGCAGIGWCGGIASYSATATIVNNVVYGVKSSSSAAVYLAEAEKAAGTVVMSSNVLDGGGVGLQGNPTRSAAVALHISFGQNMVVGRIRDNILLGGQNLNRFGIFEDSVAGKTNKPAAADHNDFFFPTLGGRTDVYWRHWDGSTNTDDTTTPASNISGDPLLDSTWHLMNGSPCIDAGTATDSPAKDRDGQSRPMGAGFDIGADEK